MQSISFDLELDAGQPAPTDLKTSAEIWFYRVGSYLLINLMDDPAWLALMFC